MNSFSPNAEFAAFVGLILLVVALFASGCGMIETINPETSEPVIVGKLESARSGVEALDDFVPPGPWKLGTAALLAGLGLTTEVFRRRANRNERTAKGVLRSVDDLLDLISQVQTPDEAKSILKKTQGSLEIRSEVDRLRG